MTGRLTPDPAPALRRAADGSVHPASAALSSLAVDVAPSLAARSRRGKEAKDARKEDKRLAAEETVVVAVPLPRSVRKKLRRRAEEYGWTPEEAAAHVLRVWADG